MQSEKVKEFLAGAGLEKAWEISTGPGMSWNAKTIRDIVGKLLAYGSVTPKQVEFLKSLVAKESGPVAVVPEGRVTVIGKVVMAEWRENAFGGIRKMLVRSEKGWAVWVTVPSAWGLGEVKGKVVEFVATVKASPTDSSFGFGSRPMAVKLLEAA